MGIRHCALIIGAIVSTGSLAAPARASIVLYGDRATIDTDGDGVPDVNDNAPNLSNPSQVDYDADQIGDELDPTPMMPGPFLGDLGLTLGGPYNIAAGSSVFIDYNVATSAIGQFGHIDLDLDNDGIYDATYFGALDGIAQNFEVTPAFFTAAGWDLNTAGTYTLKGLLSAPGGEGSQLISATIVVTPEPASFVLAAGAVVLVAGFRHERAPRQ